MKKISKIKDVESVIVDGAIEENAKPSDVESINDDDILKMPDDTDDCGIFESSPIGESLNAAIGKALKERKSDDTQERVSDSLEDRITAIKAEFDEDTVIDISNLREKSQMESAIKGKWATKVMVEKVRGNRLRKKLEQLCSGLEKMYAESRRVPSSYLNSRMATDGMLNENADVKNLRTAIEENKILVEYMERLWTAIQGFGFTLKNSIESAKLEMGI